LDNFRVAKDFEYPDRDQVFLLPPDMREWLPAGHLVWMVIDTVAALDLRAFRGRAKLGGAGRAPLDPAMLLALLIYAYAHGQRSSRQIERLCQTDIAFKVICGNRAPDHTVIARFRARNDAAFAEVFAQVLMMCAKAGLGRFGTVAIDGTKIAANASKHATRSEDSLRVEAARILAEAAAVDAAEDAEFGDARGDELPPELADPTTRAARIKEALAQIEAEKAAESEANRIAATNTDWEDRIAAARQAHDKRSRRRRRPGNGEARKPLQGRSFVVNGRSAPRTTAGFVRPKPGSRRLRHAVTRRQPGR
jgi:transposase